MSKKYCKVCSTEIHPKRVALGYSTTCVNHSTAERFTGHLVVDGKTDYSIQIIKDPAIGRKLKELAQASIG
jgi:hypothetical protein